jgi:hypothetical protein
MVQELSKLLKIVSLRGGGSGFALGAAPRARHPRAPGLRCDSSQVDDYAIAAAASPGVILGASGSPQSLIRSARNESTVSTDGGRLVRPAGRRSSILVAGRGCVVVRVSAFAGLWTTPNRLHGSHERTCHSPPATPPRRCPAAQPRPFRAKSPAAPQASLGHANGASRPRCGCQRGPHTRSSSRCWNSAGIVVSARIGRQRAPSACS